jgi:hypothetical protein
MSRHREAVQNRYVYLSRSLGPSMNQNNPTGAVGTNSPNHSGIKLKADFSI